MITTAVVVIVGSFALTQLVYCHREAVELIVVCVRRIRR